MNTEHDWITTPVTADLLRGALDLERTAHGLLPHRLPARARAQIPDGQLAMAEAQPSGVRLVFRTRATAVELDTLPTKRVYAGAPPRPDGVYDLLVDGRLAGQARVTGGNVRTIVDMATAVRRDCGRARPAPSGSPACPARDKDVEIWLPHNEITELVALRTDAPVEPAPDRGPQGVAAPRQFDQPRLRRRQPHHHLARPGRRPGRRGADQPGPRRQRPARPVHRPRDAGHPRRPDQPQDRHQPRQHRR